MTVEFADTNLFLRYLIKDVREQAEAVDRLFRRAGREEISLVTTPLVIAEIVWTLESYYRLTRSEIKAAILAIIGTPGVEIEDGDLVLQAVVWYEEKNVDFIDAYNAAWLRGVGIEQVHTFDRKHFERFGHLKVSVPD